MQEDHMENDTASIIVGILVFVVFGSLIGWLVYRHIKHTVAGTKAHIEAMKQAVGDAKEEFKIANERKEQGLGWTVPQEMVDQRMSKLPGGEEIVFGYDEEQMHAERGSHAKKGIIAGIVLLVFAGLCVLGGVLSGNNSKKISAYPTVQAKVINHRAVTRTDDDGDTYLQHYIDLEYVVDGKTYTDIDRPSDEYRKDTITVHYNPDKPEKVYFETDGEGNAYWYVIAGIVGLLGLGIILMANKEKRKPQES